jgi:hypothetical protein
MRVRERERQERRDGNVGMEITWRGACRQAKPDPFLVYLFFARGHGHDQSASHHIIPYDACPSICKSEVDPWTRKKTNSIFLLSC